MKILLTLIAVTMLTASIHAASSIHYFDLKNRPAEEVIPLLQPLLQEDEAISGTGYQIFIKTSEHRKQQISDLISTIDKAIKTFRISVTNDEYTAHRENNIEGSITARKGDAEVRVGRYPSDQPGVTLNVDTRNTEGKSKNMQFVQVQEGKPAFVSKESLHIIPIYSYVQRANGDFLIEHNQLSPTKQDGFYVIARSADGKSANVNIQSTSSNRRTYQGYGQNQTYVDTTVRIPLGEWFEIGGNKDTSESESTGVLYRTKKNQQRNQNIFLKIELNN